jgi:hypothetical protein
MTHYDPAMGFAVKLLEEKPRHFLKDAGDAGTRTEEGVNSEAVVADPFKPAVPLAGNIRKQNSGKNFDNPVKRACSRSFW